MICNSANRIHQLSGQDFEIFCQWQTLRMIIDQKCRGMVKALIPIIHIPQIAVTLRGHLDRIIPGVGSQWSDHPDWGWSQKRRPFGNNRRASWGLTTYDGYEPRITESWDDPEKTRWATSPRLHKWWDTRHMFQGLHLRNAASMIVLVSWLRPWLKKFEKQACSSSKQAECTREKERVFGV